MNILSADILAMLEEKLSPDLLYHSVQHTKSVTEIVPELYRTQQELSVEEGLCEIHLLQAAALLHDTGFLINYDNNEQDGAQFARMLLPRYGFSETETESISKLIMSTRHGHSASNINEMIMQDADLHYLGTDDYFRQSELLRREWEVRGRIYSDEEWRRLQFDFLYGHRWKSAAAKALFTEGLKRNMLQLQDEVR